MHQTVSLIHAAFSERSPLLGMTTLYEGVTLMTLFFIPLTIHMLATKSWQKLNLIFAIPMCTAKRWQKLKFNQNHQIQGDLQKYEEQNAAD